jgi:hypothetical protein
MSTNIPGSSFNIFEDSKAVVEDSSSDLVYFFRYNVVSDEGTVVTEWSTINQLKQNNILDILNGFEPTYSISSVESGGVGVNVKWTVPDSFVIKQLEIYFAWSWDTNPSTAVFRDFEYADAVTSNNYYIDIPFNGSNIKTQTPTGTTNITITTELPHKISVGEQVTISGAVPAGYNGVWTAQSGTTASTLVVNIGSNPGPITTAAKVVGRTRAKLVKATVQVPTNIKTINTNGRLFLSTAESTLPVLDGGTIV